MTNASHFQHSLPMEMASFELRHLLVHPIESYVRARNAKESVQYPWGTI